MRLLLLGLSVLSAHPRSGASMGVTVPATGSRAERHLGADERGIPMVCGTEAGSEARSWVAAAESSLPPFTRVWECIPCVIRNNGLDTFRLEVSTGGAVDSVVLPVPVTLLSASGQGRILLRDDGLGEDRVGGDQVYTSERLRSNPAWPMAPFLFHDTNSPAGLAWLDAGDVEIQELDGTTNRFLVPPALGLLNASLPLVQPVILSSNVLASDHLINVRTAERHTQMRLRVYWSDLGSLTREIYRVLPDAWDFFVLFSTDRLEMLPRTVSGNYYAGMHFKVQVNYTGTGQGLLNNCAAYGSSNRLLSVNLLDTAGRGGYSANVTHELLHQWAAYLNSSLGLTDGTRHYHMRSSVGSLLGGHLWRSNDLGGFTLICEEGRNGATHAAPLDKYLMGLIEGSAVPTLRKYPESWMPPLLLCNTNLTVFERTVTMANIQALHGVRAPGPAGAQRRFALAFVTETHQRHFNPVEMTFYEILAAHYTRPVPPAQPAPYIGQNWASMDRFFGEGTTWTSEVLPLVRPRNLALRRAPDDSSILTAEGCPGANYRLWASPDLAQWTALASQAADTNGALMFVDPETLRDGQRFYRLVTP
jgi:hypothetical protein